MILYLDTSALVKLYVPESDSAKISQLVDTAEMLQYHASLTPKRELLLHGSAESAR